LEIDPDDKFEICHWLEGRTITLASGSPRRKQIMEMLGLTFEVRPSGLPEEANTSGMKPQQYALAQAICKLQSVPVEQGVLIAADTIVVLDKLILGKPTDEDDALRILNLLSGQTHCVHTALALRDADSGRFVGDVATSRVTFRELSDEQLRDYIASGEPMDKAGAYGIQGMGELLVDRLDGSLSNVIGFPVFMFARLLRELCGEV
jgi:septum formation protein